MDQHDLNYLDHVEDDHPAPIPQWEQDYYRSLTTDCEPPAVVEKLANAVGYLVAIGLASWIFWSVV